MDRFTQYAVAAAKMALEDANLDISKETSDRVGLFRFGYWRNGNLEEQIEVRRVKGPVRVSPSFVPMMISNGCRTNCNYFWCNRT